MEMPRVPFGLRMRAALLLSVIFTVSCAHVHLKNKVFLFDRKVENPAFALGTGPRVVIDESHCNLHTAGGLYRPFAELLRRDGFVVAPLQQRFTPAALADVEVLVIANALAERNCGKNWTLPTPSAFRSDEIDAVEKWVTDGGALLLIADHMPFPGAAEDLARAFGIGFLNGYALRGHGDRTGDRAIRFERSAGTLAQNAITAGRSAAEQVDAVVSFTGQAFRPLHGDVTPLLTIPADVTLRLPRVANVFTEKTPSFSAEGLLQGAVLIHGKGRVAVFGEAAMFSAQELTEHGELVRFGMNAPGAEQNAQFVLNVMHWLAGLLGS
jgi:hypothetical protein